MSARQQLVPDESHPITITPTTGEVVVTRGDRVVARSTRSLTLQEATYPPVQYLPLADVDLGLLEHTDHTTYCPYKGEAGYYSLIVGGDRVENAVWSYPSPHDAVAEIADHVAFYPNQVETAIG